MRILKRPLRLKRRKRRLKIEANLHETYMDKTIAGDEFSVHHGEGRLRHSIKSSHLQWVGALFCLFLLLVMVRVGYLQIAEGENYTYMSENNVLDRIAILPTRGSIFDRNGEKLAWNTASEEGEVLLRAYTGEGFSSLLGFIRYPQKDKYGKYYRYETEGEGGVEELYDATLAGVRGSLVFEKNARGDTTSKLHIEDPRDGEDITLAIDAKVQKIFYESLKKITEERSFKGGAAVLLDVETGEIIALVSYPDFDNNVLTNHTQEQREEYLKEREEGSFFNRAISGLYSPGSTVKPFFAAAALEEGIIHPEDKIESTRQITVQNPYDPDITYAYKDWKAHGLVNIYDALAVSSNIYFYYVGGGYGHIQESLGIDRLSFYGNIFGFGRQTEIGVFTEPKGLIPNPEWKKNRYDEEWRVGDTYNTVIGQYSFQVTPLQMARAVAAIANGGFIVEPHLEKGKVAKKTRLAITEENLEIVRKGMRKAVTEGTATHLNTKRYTFAAKTGTAQIGKGGMVNSLLTGFFPYQEPKYAFVIIMERGEQHGAVTTARTTFDRMAEEVPEYME